jgi:hypothetical protein
MAEVEARKDKSCGYDECTRGLVMEVVSGHGVVTNSTFEAKTTGRFPVKITKAAVVHPDQQMTAASGSEITVSVQ